MTNAVTSPGIFQNNDDEGVKDVRLPDVLRKTPYILFYKLMNDSDIQNEMTTMSTKIERSSNDIRNHVKKQERINQLTEISTPLKLSISKLYCSKS